MSKIVFYSIIPSIHISGLIKELSKVYDVTFFYMRDISENRKKSGWYFPDFGSAKVLKYQFEINSAIIDEFDIHIYSGMNAYPEVHDIFKSNIKNNASKHFIIQESVTYKNRFEMALKMVKYTYFRWKYDSSINGVFSAGGYSFLKRCGFKHIVDFSYFFNNTFCESMIREVENKQLKFIYIGEISKRKRIMDFVRQVDSKDQLLLDIYGKELDDFIDVESLPSNVNYLGSLAHENVQNKLSTYDYLILPSKQEGFGMVLLEAISSGVGICASNIVGSKLYINNNIKSEAVIFCDFSDMKKTYLEISRLKPLTFEARYELFIQSSCFQPNKGVELMIKEFGIK